MICLSAVQSMAQYSYREFTNETNVDKKATIALFLWNEYLRNDIDSLKITGTQLLHDGAEQQNEFAVAVAKRSLGDYMIRTGSIKKGLKLLQNAANYFLISGDYLLYSETLASLGNGYFLMGDFKDARRAFLNSMQAGSLSRDPTAWFNAEINLGKAICSLGDTLVGVSHVVHYKDEALKLKKYEAVSNAYGYLATIELKRNNTPLAVEYLEKGIRFARKSNSKNQLTHALTNRAIQYFYQDQKDAALSLFNEALRVRKSMNNDRLVAESYWNLGFYYDAVGQRDSAVHNYTKSYQVAIQKEYLAEAKSALEKLIEISANASDELRLQGSYDSITQIIKTESETSGEILNFILSEYDNKHQHESTKSANVNNWYWIIILLPVGVELFLLTRSKLN